jgi:DNA invertase Pin-like site-specific DNA recombinase
LHRLLDHLREGDTVVVWKLDRLSRSLKDVLHIMERIGNAGAGFRSITENIDTTTPAGRMMMQMVGAYAEFGGRCNSGRSHRPPDAVSSNRRLQPAALSALV